MSLHKISASIITFNEEKDIARCIDSMVDIVDEIIVVDSFSTDKTEEICLKYPTVRFYKNPFAGHIEQKNYAKSLTSHELVLSLDADELLDDKAKQEVLAIKENCYADGYIFKRLNNYCGNWIRHGGWYPDKKLRLCKKSLSEWKGQNPHDSLVATPNAKVVELKGNILHYSFKSVEDHRKQAEKFAIIAANALFKRNKKATFINLYLSPFFKFFKDYILRFGFLDKKGWTIATISAKSTYTKYHTLKDLYNKK